MTFKKSNFNGVFSAFSPIVLFSPKAWKGGSETLVQGATAVYRVSQGPSTIVELLLQCWTPMVIHELISRTMFTMKLMAWYNCVSFATLRKGGKWRFIGVSVTFLPSCLVFFININSVFPIRIKWSDHTIKDSVLILFWMKSRVSR